MARDSGTIVVVDASVVLSWVVPGAASTPGLAALRLRAIAPDLLVPDCANALWKMVRRGELRPDEAPLIAAILERASVELVAMRSLVAAATRLAVALGHPAYDCFYLALAEREDVRFLTADATFGRKVAMVGPPTLAARVEVVGPA